MNQKKRPTPTNGKPSAQNSSIVPEQHDSGKLALVIHKDEPRIDSRVLALHFGKAHHDLFELVKNYRADFEQLGVVRFQTEKPLPGSKGGRPERFALLNEDQAYLLLTYSRNTAKARALKVKLVKAFGEARRAAQAHRAEYLPTYHELHEAIHARAAGSPNERFVHMNVNKLVNQTAGIEAGQRSGAPLPVQSLLTVAQAVAARAMQQAPDHRDGYQQAKAALLTLTQATMIEGGAA
jgi:phage regulator Rha-like protein